ncbi:transcriptional regulator with XRE-family HTH domain [Anaerotaenia torta]|uniref:helix-turn-helix domain-containing protein n=1 Tax=Anaerotaenia torta TaxID=433293 RepID=UPI003D208579
MAIWNERIKQKRLERGLTLAQIADALNVTEATAQRYESGSIKNVPYEHMCTYAKLLHCSPQYLMGWEDTIMPSLNFETKVDNTPLNRAIEKSENIPLSEEEATALKNELPKILKRIPEAFKEAAISIDNAFKSRLVSYYDSLNTDGKREALKRLEELTMIPRYTNNYKDEYLNAANERHGATEEDKAHDDAIMDDENF